jgi:hypothetical protein
MPRLKRDRHDARVGARRALSEAREIYRRRSGALPAPREPERAPVAQPPERAPVAQPPAPSRTAALARQAARRLKPRTGLRARRDDPDVYLDVSRLRVDDIDLKVAELDARVALEARLLDLLHLNVGVDARLRGVELDIEGVDAQALLKVRLDNLTTIVDRVMRTIDSNPQMLEHLVSRLGATVDELGANTVRAVRGPDPA